MLRPTLALFVACSLLPALRAADKPPTVLRTPNGGIQPQALFDTKGNLHLVYYKGKEGEGDLFYVRRAAGKRAFSEPIRVNSQPGTAVSIGTIRGGQIALGKNDRLHVVWFGSMKATPKGPSNSAPMLYSRLNDNGKGFEAQRNLMKQTFGLDGGGTVAADREGNVYVAWHGLQVGTGNGEQNRKVWLAVSTDDGESFAREQQASPEFGGACGCCSTRGFVDSKNTLHILYRAAAEKVNRDMQMLSSSDGGKKFEKIAVQQWKIENCPMSSASFAEGKGGVRAAWESGGEVFFATFAPGGEKLDRPVSPPGGGRSRKHPALGVTPSGQTVLAWAEGTGWNKGGSLAWQIFDAAGKPTSQRGRVEGGIVTWGLPCVAVDGDGNIVILH